MNSYEAVLSSISTTTSLSNHIKALGKNRQKTEDTALIELIDNSIKELQDSLIKNTKVKPIPISLDNTNFNTLKQLHAFCQKAVGTKIPEWQILAHRNGWKPPQ